MNNWLVKLAEQQPTDEEQLTSALEGMSIEDLQELASYEEPQTDNLDSFEEKMAAADQMGRELAIIHGDELEKQALAFLAPLIAGAGKLLAGGAAKLGLGAAARGGLGAVAKRVGGFASNLMPGGGGGGGGQPSYAGAGAGGGGFSFGKGAMAVKALKTVASAAPKKPGAVGSFLKDQAKDMAIGKGMEMVTNRGGRAAQPAMQSAAPMAAQAPQPQAFNYGAGKFASVRHLYIDALEKQAKAGGAVAAGLGQKALGWAVKNPNLAIGAAGAAAGALTADRDPMTGEKQWMSGALKGGLLAGGAAKMTGAGNWARKQVTTGAWGQGVKDNAVAGMRALKADKAQAAAEAAGKALPKATATKVPAEKIPDMTAHAVPVSSPPPTPAAAAPAPHPSTFQSRLGGAAPAEPMRASREPLSNVSPFIADSELPTNLGMIRGQLPAPQQPSVMVDPSLRNMSSGSRGEIHAPGAVRRAAPGNVQSGEFIAKSAMRRMSPVDRIKLAMLSKRANIFSTSVSPAAAGQAIKSSLGGMGGMGAAMKPKATPPPIPAAAMKPRASAMPGQ